MCHGNDTGSSDSGTGSSNVSRCMFRIYHSISADKAWNESILAGIIVNTGLYTINIAVMGFASQVNLFNCNTIFTMAKNAIGGGWYKLIVAALIVLVIGVILSAFLNTRLGLSIRATGDNADMVKASSINPSFTITVGLCVANAMTALSGGVLAQYQRSCDINLGTGMVTIALASLIIRENPLSEKAPCSAEY